MNFKNIFLALVLLTTIALNSEVLQNNQNCCNPCVLDCTIAGCFTVARCPINTLMPAGCPGSVICADAGEIQTISNPPVIRQCGKGFIVAPSPLNLEIFGSSGTVIGTPNEYRVFLINPFCTRVAVTVTSSSGNARLSSTTATNNSFLIEDVLPDDSVCFIAVPINK